MLAYLIEKKSFTLTLLFILCMAISAVMYKTIPLEIMPKENVPPFLYLNVGAGQSATPEKIESNLTIPVEGVIRTLSSIQEFSSRTSKKSASFSITYNPGTDIDLAFFNLNESLQDLEEKEILNMKNVQISKFNPEADAIIKLSITYDKSIKDISKLIKEELKIGLESLSSIVKVEIQGVEPLVYDYKIEMSQLNELNIKSSDLSSELQFEQKRETLGSVPIPSENKRTSITSRLINNQLSAVKRTRIKKGTELTLDKIAKQKIIDQSKENIRQKNGEMVVFVEIYNKESANLFQLKDELEQYLQDLKKENSDLSLLNFEYIFNKTDDLKSAIANVFESLYLAILITSIVVLIFLGKLKLTIIISLVIPSTLLLAVSILNMKGSSLNILTLSGLILSIGLIVDNAIVVTERIQQLKDQGLNAIAAAAQGASDVAIPLLISTLTTVIIFLPAAFIEGGDSFTDMLKAFQVPVISALLGSYFVALLFVPIGTFWIKSPNRSNPGNQENKDQDETEVSPILFKLFKQIYRFRLLLSGIILLVIFFVGRDISSIEETDLETPRDPYVTVNIKFAPEIEPEQRKELFQSIEKELIQKKEQFEYKFLVSDFNPKYISGAITLYPYKNKKSDKSLKAMEKTVNQYLGQRKQVPGFSALIGFGAYHAQKRRRKTVLKVAGPKTSKIEQVLFSLKKEIEKIKGISEVKTTKTERGRLGFNFIPFGNILSRYGLTLAKLSREISSQMSNISISDLQQAGQSVGAKVTILPPSGKWDLKSFDNMKISLGSNQHVTLQELGKLQEVRNLSSISRKKGISTSALYVYFDEALKSSDIRRIRNKVRKLHQQFDYPKGYGLPVRESDQKVAEMRKQSQFVLLLSIFLIYLLIAGLFESPLIPFAILFTVPLAVVFGVAGLHYSDMTLDPMARLGLIILVGIVVNNAIILIDVIKKLKAKGFKRNDAIILGCSQRFMAVMTTSATTILGLIPVAFGEAKLMGIPYSSFGICIMSGMTFSTLITLILLPVIYELFENLEQKVKVILRLA